jgi:hypothetical protein
MKFAGVYQPRRDPTLRYEYEVTIHRDHVTTWEARILCNGELHRPVTGIIDFAPKEDSALRAEVERWVMDSIERRIGVD